MASISRFFAVEKKRDECSSRFSLVPLCGRLLPARAQRRPLFLTREMQIGHETNGSALLSPGDDGVKRRIIVNAFFAVFFLLRFNLFSPLLPLFLSLSLQLQLLLPSTRNKTLPPSSTTTKTTTTPTLLAAR